METSSRKQSDQGDCGGEQVDIEHLVVLRRLVLLLLLVSGE